MKLKLQLAYLTAALMLPAMAAMADEKEKAKEEPRPAQESKSGATTGKETTQPSTEAPTPARPATATEDGKTQPRPAQESKSGATTGRDATKSPEKPADSK